MDVQNTSSDQDVSEQRGSPGVKTSRTWMAPESALAQRGSGCFHAARIGSDFSLSPLTTGILDPEREMSIDEVFATLELPVQRYQAELRPGGSAEVIDRIYHPQRSAISWRMIRSRLTRPGPDTQPGDGAFLLHGVGSGT